MSKRGELLFKICPQCGKEFSYMKSKERKYCSKECFCKSKQTGKEIMCDNCGKPFYRRQYHIDRQKNKGQNSFCCTRCQKEYLHKQTYEIRKCEICGQEFEVSKLSTQRFCSDECQIKWQTTRIRELNPKFTSILTSCTYCGKEHYVKPYKFEQQENFFCSKECRQTWYSEVYSQREDWKEASRQRILQQFQNNIFGTETVPQKIVNDILDEIGVNYVREQVFEFYAVDNYLLDFNLIIEVQGDYWHTNPLKFMSNLTEVQYNRIGKDKSKHSYFKNQYNIEILYLWETDILKNKELCTELIKKYINSNGVLHNYHSFNYDINNNKLLLNDEIVIPYQDMSSEQYKQTLIS
jgi:very-short-patch-repair endonuclease